MTAIRYSPSAVRTLAAAMGRAADAHDYVLTDTSTGHVKGVYVTQELAVRALQRMATTSGVYVLSVLHPANCDCAEVT